MSTRTTPAGFRSADATIAARCHNLVAMVLCEGSERAVIRRLLVLSDMLRATAERLSRRDFEVEGEGMIAAFWQRRADGERDDEP
jgi:hypothetical protein